MAGGPIRRMISKVLRSRSSSPRSRNCLSKGSERPAPLTKAASAIARTFGSLAIRRFAQSSTWAEFVEGSELLAWPGWGTERVVCACACMGRIQSSVQMNSCRMVAGLTLLYTRPIDGDAAAAASVMNSRATTVNHRWRSSLDGRLQERDARGRRARRPVSLERLLRGCPCYLLASTNARWRFH